MDIRLYTRCVIISREETYLQCRSIVTGELIWSDSPYDAWATRKLASAFRVAHRVGGSVRLFNPIIGRTAPLRKLTKKTA